MVAAEIWTFVTSEAFLAIIGVVIGGVILITVVVGGIYILTKLWEWSVEVNT